MRQRIAAIINPVSGRHNMTRTVNKIAGEIQRAGGRFEVRTTAGLGHATSLAAELARNVEALLVVGGDGTVCEVINGLIDHPVPIAILRTGTENLLACELEMPTEPRAVARALLSGSTYALDVGVVNDRCFLAVAGAGFDAECVLRMSRSRRGHITHADYFWPIWRSFWAYRFAPLTIVVDDRQVFSDRGFAIFGVIGRYSLGMRILDRAQYDDGLLDLCVFPCRTRRELVAHAVRIVAGRHTRGAGVQYHQGRRIRITSSSTVPLQIDGDVAGELPAECSILRHAIRFVRIARHAPGHS